MRSVGQMAAEGNEEAANLLEAFILQIAKDIGSMACVLKGKVDQILLTGGIAYNPSVVPGLKERIDFIAPVTVYPGEDELLALAQGGLRVMTGQEQPMTY